MSERDRSFVDVNVLLQRIDGYVLLLKRDKTRYTDGTFWLPGGGLQRGESLEATAIREAEERVGVRIAVADLRFDHVVHYRTEHGSRIGFFVATSRWQGEPINREPDKCAALCWVDPRLPRYNTVAHIRGVLEQVPNATPFSVDGWFRRKPPPCGLTPAPLGPTR